jgi:uncharacterized protein YceK
MRFVVVALVVLLASGCAHRFTQHTVERVNYP